MPEIRVYMFAPLEGKCVVVLAERTNREPLGVIDKLDELTGRTLSQPT